NLVTDAGVELLHAPDRAAYATIPIEGRRETWPLRSTGFRHYLNHLFFLAPQKTAGRQAVEGAAATPRGRAGFQGPGWPVRGRLAEHEGKVYLDLADAQWQVVEVDAAGWRVVAEAPVRFRRPRGLLPLPVPVPGGRVEDLRPFVNVATEDDWRLLVGWLV